ncbi:MAG: hypothetical protein HOJ35_02305 [Bdellovibrionales bacterium]|jgi:hypothetical protein|nr:hypothetical protein [Bdellovibrionales bacterium]
MINVSSLKRHFTSKTIKNLKSEVLKRILANPHNKWLTQDKFIHRSFTEFIHSLNNNALNFLYSINEQIIFLQATGSLSLSLSTKKDNHYILVFPQLFNMLKSASPRRGIAILMHELGHIYLDHGNKKIDILEAQIEADHFALTHGFGHELQDVLLDDNSIDSQTRICYLTSHLITSSN